jgi:TolB protein
MFYKLLAAVFLISTTLSGSALLVGRAQPHSILAFISERSGRAQVYLLDADHLITYRVSSTEYDSSAPAWSFSGDLAYVRSLPDGRDIVVMNPFRGGRCEVNRRQQDESAPAWSPDGELAYVIGSNGRYDIYVQDGCAGQTARNMTRDSNHSASRPRWSSAGRLAYNDEAGSSLAVVLLDPNSGESTFVRRRMGLDYAPIWFEDRLLAFGAVYEGSDDRSNFEVFVFDTETGEFRNVSNHPAVDQDASWSPDGRLAFSSNRDGNYDIYVYDFASNTLTNVTHSPENDIAPAWSPDGRLAYASASGTVYDILMLDRVPGGKPRRIVSHPSQDYNPLWMP